MSAFAKGYFRVKVHAPQEGVRVQAGQAAMLMYANEMLIYANEMQICNPLKPHPSPSLGGNLGVPACLRNERRRGGQNFKGCWLPGWTPLPGIAMATGCRGAGALGWLCRWGARRAGPIAKGWAAAWTVRAFGSTAPAMVALKVSRAEPDLQILLEKRQHRQLSSPIEGAWGANPQGQLAFPPPQDPQTGTLCNPGI